ncbi:regulatory iron-sulfur-containing complex subunit RicT [Lignipirellula cremea]|uniref:PSP1 C-terminal domain-containing protein n=1 Tax=Lignipirellula cremea TaxID=2528010 RepID=A0A518DQ79_9BACT|nr:regulatory iron-sulfur-containing complex subunit RicT [Lignipirellula cremea]QDU94005.1 hypothetical protein Pla8534_17910 [Lignipirellula cremea]
MAKYIVRYGSMRHLGVLSTRGNDRFRRGSQVIARTQRGLEAGEVLCDATEEAVSQLSDTSPGQILREMTEQDTNEQAHLLAHTPKTLAACREHIKRLGLDMQLVDVEHLFGGERIVVYYLAEHRVDFRELVRSLASEFQTRIEMRQIGVRDEAKLLADYGDCGKPVCCNTHLSAMPPVSMKMAKVQKATLDPTKISGRCGRLKCCLRYEYDTYEALLKQLPPVGSDVVTADGRARVLSQEILAEQLLVSTEDNRRMLINASDVLSVLKRGSGKGKPRSRGPERGRNENRDKPPQEETQGAAQEKPPQGDSREKPPRGEKRNGPPRGDKRGGAPRGDKQGGPANDDQRDGTESKAGPEAQDGPVVKDTSAPTEGLQENPGRPEGNGGPPLSPSPEKIEGPEKNNETESQGGPPESTDSKDQE